VARKTVKIAAPNPPPFFTEEGDRRTAVEEAGFVEIAETGFRGVMAWSSHGPRLLHHFVVPLLRYAEED